MNPPHEHFWLLQVFAPRYTLSLHSLFTSQKLFPQPWIVCPDYPGPRLPSLSRQGTVPLANVPEALGISSKQLVCSMSLAKVGVHPVVFRGKIVWKSTVYHNFRFVHSIRQDARKVYLKTVDRHHFLGTIWNMFPKAFNIARGEQSSRTLRTDPVVWSATLRMPCCRTW